MAEGSSMAAEIFGVDGLIILLVFLIPLGIAFIVVSASRSSGRKRIQSQAPYMLPAGWYADPYGSGNLRWWDGFQWTAGEQPGPYATKPPTGPLT